VALQGTLDTFALPDVLRLLAATKKTGRLHLTGGRGTGSIWAATGEVVGIDATHAPHATEPVEALFELLRFEEGSFTFDAEATHDDPWPATDAETLISQAEALLDEWRTIEAVVPSMDGWVTLRSSLPGDEVTIDQARWNTLVAVSGGATVRRVADELCLAELPVSRAVKELVELGLVDLTDAPPAGAVSHIAPPSAVVSVQPSPPLLSGDPELSAPPSTSPALSTSTPSGPRARRARGPVASDSTEPDVFVPLELPGQGPAPSYDDLAAEVEADESPHVDAHDEPVEPADADDLAAAFPGLANRSTPTAVDVDDEELAKQLATLSPRAASAIRAAAEATTDEERDAALDEVDDEDQPLNRGLLLKFLSSVKS